MNEVWKSIDGWPEYQVSDLGNVRRILKSPSPKATKKNAENMGRPLSPSVHRDGYLYVCLKRPGHYETKKVHRLVCEAFHGKPPLPNMDVNHKDTVRSNCAATNLEWMTRQENLEHARIHGNGCRKGRRNAQAKLSENQIIAIREDERTQREIATDYDVCQQTVSLIKSRKSWSHI